jgi:hypothetical protein
MSNKKYILNYFNKHGKVELCRLILAAAKIDYEDNFIENLTDSGILYFLTIFGFISRAYIYFLFQDTTLAFMPYLQIEDKTKIPLISVICRLI